MPLVFDTDCQTNLPDTPLHNLYSWADFIELLCLSHEDMEYSNEEYATLRLHAQDLVDSSADGDEGDTSGIAVKRYERWEEHGRKCFAILRFRAAAYGEYYPFDVTRSGIQLTTDYPTEKHLFYLYLLFSANLRYFGNSLHTFTNDFECVSLQAMEQMLPDWAESHVFGTGNCGRASRYTGNVEAKINKLAADVCGTALSTHFPRTSTGDAGLDLVAWTSLDKASHFPTYFAQCGCTDHWNEKQFSASFEKWHNTIHLPTGLTSLVFVPHCLRGADGLWFNPGEMSMCSFIDRSRFVRIHDLSGSIILPDASRLILLGLLGVDIPVPPNLAEEEPQARA